MLEKGGRKQPADAVTPEEELKDPLVREFLGLKDEYSDPPDTRTFQGAE